MPRNKTRKSFFSITSVLILAVIILLILAGLWLISKHDSNITKSTGISQILVKNQSIIDYNNIDNDSALKEMMKQRKTDYGLENGVDIILKPDEALKIGGATVPMQRIIEKIQLNSGEIVESDIESKAEDLINKSGTFGITIVKKNDNIWNIHFGLLKDYFNHRGITLTPASDEPDQLGYSSGVGKLLKFSENIVSIYNIKENRLDVNINLIHPLNKLVVYNMTQIFGLFNSIDYSNVNNIQFDGETLWIPSE